MVGKLIQDAMYNYYFAHTYNEGSLFLSSHVKFVSKTLKSKHCLNVGKNAVILADKRDGCVDFTKCKHDHIIETMQLNHSNLSYDNRVIIMNDIVTKLKLLKHVMCFPV